MPIKWIWEHWNEGRVVIVKSVTKGRGGHLQESRTHKEQEIYFIPNRVTVLPITIVSRKPSFMQSNLQILTQAHTAVAAKKRASRQQLKEVVFDEEARLSVHIISLLLILISSFSGIFLLDFINESLQKHRLLDKKPYSERNRID